VLVNKSKEFANKSVFRRNFKNVCLGNNGGGGGGGVFLTPRRIARDYNWGFYAIL
jgi:hypothetical protein